VSGYRKKPGGDGDWINAGFFVAEPHLEELRKSGNAPRKIW
jgi:hypothetical protein